MDTNYRSIADNVEPVTIEKDTICPSNPLDYSDILKFSNAKDCIVSGCHICGGKEDVVDMNRNCRNIRIEDCNLVINGQQGFTIKGGCKDIVISHCVFIGNPSNVEIELGNYSEQSDEPPTNISLVNLIRDDRKPVRVRLLNCDANQVRVIGGEIEVLKPWWVKIGLFKVYCFLRKQNIIK